MCCDDDNDSDSNPYCVCFFYFVIFYVFYAPFMLFIYFFNELMPHFKNNGEKIYTIFGGLIIFQISIAYMLGWSVCVMANIVFIAYPKYHPIKFVHDILCQLEDD